MSDGKEWGWWYALVAKGPNFGWDRTLIGVAVYRQDDGVFYGSAFGSLERAVVRGDGIAGVITSDHLQWPPAPPETHGDMTRRVESTGNAMSALAWEGGHGCLLYPGLLGALEKLIVSDDPPDKTEGGGT